MAVLLILIPVCFFVTERLTALAERAVGINVYNALFCVCAAACGVAFYFSRKYKIKNRLYVICAGLGIPTGFFVSGVTCAQGILSKIGSGMLLWLYLYLIFLFFAGVRLKKPKKEMLIFTAAVLAVSNICAALYAFSCEYIYYWDNATYWTIVRDIAGGNMRDGFFSVLYNSILTLDYNYLAGLLPALFARIFGSSRTVYIFAVINCFFVPGAVMIYAYSKNVLRACTVILMLPVLLFLALTGFVDVAGFSLCIACFVLYSSSKGSWRRSFAIGALLAVLILIRRWYAFFGVSFIAAMAVDCAVSKRNIKYVLLTGVHTAFILMMFFSPLVLDKLLADYSSLYAGYKFSLMTDVKLFARYFGVLPFAALAAGCVWCGVKKDWRFVMPIVQTAVCFVLFVRTQTHGQQHLLLYVPAAAVLMIYTLEKLEKRSVYVVLAASICISANTLVDRVQPQSLAEIKHLAVLPDFSMRGRKREDVHEVLTLKNTLDKYYGDVRLGINASSFVINADILKNVQPSLGEKDFGGDYIDELPSVDSRDRDMSRFYEMEYILTTMPVQVHLGEDKQRVVVAADECLRSGTAFGGAFEHERQLELNDIRIDIYKRTREVTDKEKTEFEEIIN